MAQVAISGRRRWLGYASLVIVFSTVCGLLAWWQFARNEQAQERVRQVVENWDAAPTGLDSLIRAPDAAFDPADTWTPVELVGEYAVEQQLLVRGRPRDGKPGFEVLVPLVLANGDGVLIVDRGWVPVGETQATVPDFVPAAPEGPITVIARMKSGEPSVPGRSAPEGQVATIELPLIATTLAMPDLYTSAYGILASEHPAVATPLLATRPEPDPGPHLSYAFQWILFALFAAVALIWAIRNERLVRKEGYVAKPGRARIGEADSAQEDALVDAASAD